MFDTDFGDCFRIENEHVETPLYVDFGIHRRSSTLTGAAETNRYEEIINDMPKEKDFLLTHYHDDHFSGAVYMGQNYPHEKFRDVYIPDVWDTTDDYLLIRCTIMIDIHEQILISFLFCVLYAEVMFI